MTPLLPPNVMKMTTVSTMISMIIIRNDNEDYINHSDSIEDEDYNNYTARLGFCPC